MLYILHVLTVVLAMGCCLNDPSYCPPASVTFYCLLHKYEYIDCYTRDQGTLAFVPQIRQKSILIMVILVRVLFNDN